MLNRDRSRVVILVAGALAAFLYSNFLLDWILRGFTGMTEVVSRLAADGEPYAVLLRVTDVVCAVLVLVLLPGVRARLRPSGWRNAVVWGTSMFAVGAIVAAIVPTPCGPDGCDAADQTWQLAVHDVSSLLSTLGVFIGMAAAWFAVRDVGPSWFRRSAWWIFWVGGVGGGVLIAYFGLTQQPDWAVGVCQRLQIVAVSAWILCLSWFAAGPDAPKDPHQVDDRWPDRFAVASLLAGLFVAVVSLVPPWRSYFERPDDVVSLVTIPIVPNLVYAALLMAMAIALRRRLRAAWWIMLVWWLLLPQVGRVVDIAGGYWVTLNLIGFVLITAVVVVAVRARPQFSVRRVAGSLRSAVLAFVVGGVVVLLGGAALVSVFGDSPDLGASAGYVYNTMLADIGRFSVDTTVTAPLWIRAVLNIVGAAVVIGAATLLFRAPRDDRGLSVADEAAVRTLLRDHGEHDSLGYFATRRDKSVVWDTSDPTTAKAGVSYGVFGSVSLASGNPLGDPVHWAGAIEAWRLHARANGWSVAVMGAGPEGATAYAAAGLSVYELGDEAVVDMGAFSLAGPGMKAVRRSVTRLQRRGYTARVIRHASVTPAEFAALAESAAAWRGDGGDERGFSMALGRLADPLDGSCVLVEAHDGDGVLHGFLSFVPWGRAGLSLDLMRRDPDSDSGIVEFMVASLAASAGTLGVGPVSLNFAMFRESFERGAELGAGPMQRLWRQGLLLASKNWQLESLYRSNAKYLPDWQPRYVCFEYGSDLPRVGIAAGSAEGFLTRPSISLLRRHGAPPPNALDTGGEAHAAAVLALIPPPRDIVAEALSTSHLPEQMRVRRDKLDRLRAQGVDPYPVGYPRTHTLAQARAAAGDLAPDAETGIRVGVAGRVMLDRPMGKLAFATLRDGSGDLQVMIDADRLGVEGVEFWTHAIDLGDHVGVTGELIATHTGEITVRAEQVALTSKALRPLPDKHKGLSDPDARIRSRYVDLIMRPEARTIAYQRAAVVRSIRDSLQARGFTEVETPVLQTIHGGANARPFETHINAFDMDLYLRIATELHLKRLLVGGMEKVFEVGRQFRNEGVDFKHNPEFTSLEVYETYGDYTTMRVLTQELIQEAATAIYGSPVTLRRDADGVVVEHDLSGSWPVKTICEAVSEALGEEVTADTPLTELLRHAERIGLDLDPEATWGPVLEDIYAELCEGQTTTPVFYTDFPKENSPLTRPHRDDPRLAEKWDLVIFGAEQGTAYSELVDPLDQRERLVAQSLLAAAGDAEAMQVDEDFLRALEYGMPPTGGMGLGVDRLVMNLTDLSIRDTILFPLVRPQR